MVTGVNNKWNGTVTHTHTKMCTVQNQVVRAHPIVFFVFFAFQKVILKLFSFQKILSCHEKLLEFFLKRNENPVWIKKKRKGHH